MNHGRMNHSETNIVTINPKIGMSTGDNRRLLHKTMLHHEFRNSCMRIQMSIDHAHHGMGMELRCKSRGAEFEYDREAARAAVFVGYVPTSIPANADSMTEGLRLHLCPILVSWIRLYPGTG